MVKTPQRFLNVLSGADNDYPPTSGSGFLLNNNLNDYRGVSNITPAGAYTVGQKSFSIDMSANGNSWALDNGTYGESKDWTIAMWVEFPSITVNGEIGCIGDGSGETVADYQSFWRIDGAGNGFEMFTSNGIGTSTVGVSMSVNTNTLYLVIAKLHIEGGSGDNDIYIKATEDGTFVSAENLIAGLPQTSASFELRGKRDVTSVNGADVIYHRIDYLPKITTDAEDERIWAHGKDGPEVPESSRGYLYVAFDGDSILSSANAPYNTPVGKRLEDRIAAALGDEYTPIYKAIGGKKVSDLITDFPSKMAVLEFPSWAELTIFLFAGTNDVNGGDSPETANTAIGTYISTALGSFPNANFVVGTPIARTLHAGLNLNLETLRGLILAGSGSSYRVADFGGLPEFTPTTPSVTQNSTYYHADEEHPKEDDGTITLTPPGYTAARGTFTMTF